MAGHTHPLAMPLLGAVAACAFGSLYWFFGIGGTPLHGALTFAVLYSSIVAVVFGIAGSFVRGQIARDLQSTARSSEQQR